MLKKNQATITHIANNTIQQHITMKCDVLTKGRQTWCPLTRRSVPSSTAFQEIKGFFKLNLGTFAINCFEWIRTFFQWPELDRLKIVQHNTKTVTRTRYDKTHHQRLKRTKTIRTKKIIEITENTEIRRYVFNLAREFCSYIKHGERAKLQRRAIASPNMIKRMLLKIIEQFHLDSGKVIEGSTISIGEEKKPKNNHQPQLSQNQLPDKFQETSNSGCHKVEWVLVCWKFLTHAQNLLWPNHPWRKQLASSHRCRELVSSNMRGFALDLS